MRCCICGTVRNCGKYLDKIFSNMEIIGSIFDNYKIILYYDISDDNTLEKIKNYQRINSNLILYENKNKLLPYRTHRIALGRNKCLNIIREQFSDYEYFIMMDCDDRCAKDINIRLFNPFDNLKYECNKPTTMLIGKSGIFSHSNDILFVRK